MRTASGIRTIRQQRNLTSNPEVLQELLGGLPQLNCQLGVVSILCSRLRDIGGRPEECALILLGFLADDRCDGKEGLGVRPLLGRRGHIEQQCGQWTDDEVLCLGEILVTLCSNGSVNMMVGFNSPCGIYLY